MPPTIFTQPTARVLIGLTTVVIATIVTNRYPPGVHSRQSHQSASVDGKIAPTRMQYRHTDAPSGNEHFSVKDAKRHARAQVDHPYCCDEDECSCAFVNRKGLRLHQRTHSRDKYRYKCPHDHCEKSYTQEDHLTRHCDHDHESDATYRYQLRLRGGTRASSSISRLNRIFFSNYGTNLVGQLWMFEPAIA